MLIYHPAFDAYHAAFRFLLLLQATSKNEMKFARLRILDFYLLFPSELTEMTLPKDLVSHRKHWKSSTNKYNDIIDPRRIFNELEPFQVSGLQLAIASGFVVFNKSRDHVSLSSRSLPTSLSSQLDKSTRSQADLLEFLTKSFSSIDLYGRDGLKARTRLFEYRYDPT